MIDIPLLALVIGLFLLLMFLGIPIAFSMGIAGVLGLIILKGWGVFVALTALVPFRQINSWVLVCLPLFVLMGNFAEQAGISNRAYELCYKVFGSLKGGLAMASIGACAAFGAVTGSSAAALVTIGTSAIPQMRRYGYSTKLATGCIAAAGFLAFAIPPSNILVLYGIICEQSIGKLFMASMVPGIITAAIFITGTWLMAKFIPTMAPVTPVKFTLKERVTASLRLWEVVILFLIVMGGLYTGVYTASEAGAIGGFAALIMLLAHRRTRSLRFIYQGMKDASSTTCMILIVIMSAAFMNLYMVLGGVAKAIETSMTSLPVGPTGVIIIIVLMYILMGMFLDTIAMVLLTAPILLPVVVNLGYDPIWFGVFVTQMVEVALITPPMAMNIFIVRGMVPDVPFTDIAIGIVPYLIMELIVVALLIAFPQIALWLPSLMMS